MSGRSGTQGEFGPDDLPLWPVLRHEIGADQSLTVHTPPCCPRGHDVRGRGPYSWLPGLRRHALVCGQCRTGGEPVHEWVLIDPVYELVSDAGVAGIGMEIVAVPPDVDAGPGRLELRVDGRARASAEVALCSLDRTGVVVHVRTDEPFRRLGYGRALVLAALARGPGYSWSTTAIESTTVAAGFAVTIPIERVGEPRSRTATISAAHARRGTPRSAVPSRRRWG